MTRNDHVQAISKALSDLFNDEHISPEDARDLVLDAWRTAAIADCCDQCPPDDSRMVWPYTQIRSDGRLDGAFMYECRHRHTWPCWWSDEMLNRPLKTS